MSSTTRPSTVDGLKKRAKTIKAELKPHYEALEIASRSLVFNNIPDAQNRLGSSDAGSSQYCDPSTPSAIEHKPRPFMGMFEVEQGSFECEALRFIYAPDEIRFELRATEGEYGPCVVEGKANRHAAGWVTTMTKSSYELDGSSGGKVKIIRVDPCAEGLEVDAEWDESEESWQITAMLEPFNLVRQQELRAAHDRPLKLNPIQPAKPTAPQPVERRRLKPGLKPMGVQYWPPRSRVTVYDRSGEKVEVGTRRDYLLSWAMTPDEGKTSRTSVVGISVGSVSWSTWTTERVEAIEAAIHTQLRLYGFKRLRIERESRLWRKCSSEFRWRVSAGGHVRHEPII